MNKPYSRYWVNVTAILDESSDLRGGKVGHSIFTQKFHSMLMRIIKQRNGRDAVSTEWPFFAVEKGSSNII